MSNQYAGRTPLAFTDEPADEPDLPKRADALANRTLILETARRLFRSRGIERVTMADIAAAAGVGKGTLYRAVANKGELCLALMDGDLRAFQEETLSMLRAHQHESALARLTRFLDGLIRFMDQHSALMCEAEAQGVRWHTRPEMGQTSLHGWFHLTVRRLLARAQAEGALAADGDADYWTDAVLAPLAPRLFVHQRQGRGYSVDEISHRHRAFVLHGINAR